MKKVIVILIGLVITINSAVYANASQAPELQIKSGILIEGDSGKAIYTKNEKEKLPIASITKLMTYLLAQEAINKGKISETDIVTISKKASIQGGASLYLREGEKISLKELIKATLIVSANDAAFAVGEYVGKDEAKFVNMMNAKAKELGMKDTVYFNPNGMPLQNGAGNISTAKDLSILCKHLIDKYGKQMLPITNCDLYKNESRNYVKESTNHILLKLIPEVDGLKTGYTDKAGYCLVSTMKTNPSSKDEDNLRLISVALGATTVQNRSFESKKLLDYGKDNFVKKIIIPKGTALEYKKGISFIKLPFKMILPQNISVLKSKEEASKLDMKKIVKEKEITLKENLKFPMKKGDKIGKVKLILKDKSVITSDLVLDKKLEKEPVSLKLKLLLNSISKKLS